MTIYSQEDIDQLQNPDPDAVPGGPAIFTQDEDTDVTPPTPPTPPAPEPPAPYKYPDDYRIEALRGKTADEAATLVQGAQTLVQNLLQTARPVQQAAPATPARDEPMPELTADDLLGTDPAVVNRKLNELFDRKAQPLLADVHQATAESNWKTARTDANMPYFQKYEQEILGYAQQLPVAQMAKPQAWALLYQNVVASHMNEILQEERTKWAAEASRNPAPPPVERGRGSNPLVVSPNNKKISDEQRAVLRALGVSEEDALPFM